MAGTKNSGIPRDDLINALKNGKFGDIITVSKDDKFANFCCADYDDDATCIQAAIDYSKLHTCEVLICGPDTYTITTQLTITNSTVIRGINLPTLSWDVQSLPLFYCIGYLRKTVSVLSDVSVGDTSVSISDVSNIIPHDLIIIYDDTVWSEETTPYDGWKTGEIHEVINVSGNIINFSEGLLHSYSVDKHMTARVAKPSRIIIDGIKFVSPAGDNNYEHISLNYVGNSHITNCVFENGGNTAVLINNSYNVDVSTLKISNCEYAGYGYGINVSNACAHINVYHSYISQCRHCIASGGTGGPGQVRDLNVFNNTIIHGSGWSLDAHQIVESINVFNNKIYNEYDFALVSSAKKTTFKNNRVYGGNGCGVRGFVRDVIYEIDGNSFENCGNVFLDTTANGPGYATTERYVSIKNNNVINAKAALADIRNASEISIENNYIDSGIAAVPIVTPLADGSSTDGWTQYEGTVSSMSIENGRIKVVGQLSTDHRLLIKKTFSQSVGSNKYISYSIECPALEWAICSVIDANSNKKSWWRTSLNSKLVPNTNTKFTHELNADVGTIFTLPSSVDADFDITTLSGVIIGIWCTSAVGTHTFYIDDIHMRTGDTADNTSIYVSSVNKGNINGNIIQNSYGSGIQLWNCSQLKIAENTIESPNRSTLSGSAFESGIALTDCTYNYITGNKIIDADGNQRYGVCEYGTSDNNTIKNNNISGANVAQITKLGANTKIALNDGYTTENTGTATIVATTTSIVVPHGLALAPTNVIVTPRGNIGSVWADTFTATQFTVHCSTAPASDTIVGWSAVV